MNCTFTKYEFGMKLRDYNICNFAQAMFGLDDFNRQLGTHTKTVGTEIEITLDLIKVSSASAT